jgi:hypothetical protein
MPHLLVGTSYSSAATGIPDQATEASLFVFRYALTSAASIGFENR